jgi:DNA mismatch repair protein MutL
MTNRSRIRVLSATVANKIAAGEVVERPASVFKELMENALDAGATTVDVEIVAGGRRLVAVEDNGRGMGRDDALLSVERHATSKISDVDDIEHIETLGFRGEALAAIASVSRFRMTSCPDDTGKGTEILISGGTIRDVRDLGCPQGTRIEVRDLFFNVPARRKFLRSHQTELGHLRNRFIYQALSHPMTRMSLKVDNRPVYELAGGQGDFLSAVHDRIRDLFGAEYAAALKPVRHVAGDIRISGFAGPPGRSRADRNEWYLFVNGRATGAPVLGHAILEGYHSLLPAKRFPVVFLFVDIPPGDVDVNVHPTKKEIRFRSTSDVRDAVIAALQDALEQKHPAPEPPIEQPFATPTETPLVIEDLPATHAFRYPRMIPLEPTGGRGDPSPQADSGNGETTPPGPDAPWSWCRVLGQIGGLYVVLETEDGYVLMDPHAAHERVLFERYMNDVLKNSVTAQALLMPESIDLHPKDASRVRKNLDVVQKMGFGIAEFGGDTFVVDAVPSHFAGASTKDILVEIARNLEQAGSRGGRGRWREESIAQAACKAAIKAKDRLSLAEIEKLVVDLAGTQMPYTCPHGRPTVILTSYHEINRKFGRE